MGKPVYSEPFPALPVSIREQATLGASIPAPLQLRVAKGQDVQNDIRVNLWDIRGSVWGRFDTHSRPSGLGSVRERFDTPSRPSGIVVSVSLASVSVDSAAHGSKELQFLKGSGKLALLRAECYAKVRQ